MRDKAFWQSIVDNKYVIPDIEDLPEMTNYLFDFLASPDPSLRHEIGYNILSRWIAIYRYHDQEQLVKMATWLMNKLDSGIGEVDTDTVFMRSSSAAILSLIVYRDLGEHFIGRRDLVRILDAAKTYLLYERDIRAYDPEKGWINALANASSVLRYLAMNDTMPRAELRGLLQAVSDKIMQPAEAAYEHDEEERIARIIIPIMRSDKLKHAEYAEWVGQFQVWLEAHPIVAGQYSNTRNHTYQNIKRFLRALHVQMLFDDRLPKSAMDSQVELLEAIRAFSL